MKLYEIKTTTKIVRTFKLLAKCEHDAIDKAKLSDGVHGESYATQEAKIIKTRELTAGENDLIAYARRK